LKRLRVYIDTSVIGGCLDPEFAPESRALLEMARTGKVTLVVSDVLGDELEEAPPAVQKVFDSLSDDCLEYVETGPEEEALRRRYVESGVVRERSAGDALHVAAATVARADMIVSWNFKHIVNYAKIRGFNAVNMREGYFPIEIRSPREVVSYDEE